MMTRSKRKEVLFKKVSGHAALGGRPSIGADWACRMDIMDFNKAVVFLNTKYINC